MPVVSVSIDYLPILYHIFTCSATSQKRKNLGIRPQFQRFPAPEHITHIHCRLFQHLVSYVRVDVRRGLVVRVADDLHRDQWTKKGGRLYNTIRLPPTYPVLLLFCQPQILIHSRPRDPYAMRITPSFVIFSPIRIVILQAKKRLRIFSLTIS